MAERHKDRSPRTSSVVDVAVLLVVTDARAQRTKIDKRPSGGHGAVRIVLRQAHTIGRGVLAARASRYRVVIMLGDRVPHAPCGAGSFCFRVVLLILDQCWLDVTGW